MSEEFPTIVLVTSVSSTVLVGCLGLDNTTTPTWRTSHTYHTAERTDLPPGNVDNSLLQSATALPVLRAEIASCLTQITRVRF
jgi:hypothetical protein